MPINTTEKMTKFLKWEDAPDILKPKEAAKLMRVGKNKIYELATIEGFPKFPIGEKHFIIPKEALRMWIEKQANKGQTFK